MTTNTNARPVTTIPIEISYRLDTISYPSDDPLGRSSYFGQVRVETRGKAPNDPKGAPPPPIISCHGVGLLRFHDGGEYRGDFRDNRRFGSGKQIYADGRVYIGDWVEDQPHGRGRVQNLSTAFQSSGNASAKTFSASNKQVASIYEGEFKAGKRHGRGLITWQKHGDFYRGSFIEGEISGLGIHVFRSGDYYSGEWSLGKHCGYGCQYFSDEKCWFEGFGVQDDSSDIRRIGIYCWERPTEESVEYVGLAQSIVTSSDRTYTPPLINTASDVRLSETPQSARKHSIISMAASVTTKISEGIHENAIATEERAKQALQKWMNEGDCVFSGFVAANQKPTLDMKPKNIAPYVETVYQGRKAAQEAIFCYNMEKTNNISDVLQLTAAAIRDAQTAVDETDSAIRQQTADKSEDRVSTPSAQLDSIRPDEISRLSVRTLRKLCDKFNIPWFSSNSANLSFNAASNTLSAAHSTMNASALSFGSNGNPTTSQQRPNAEDVILVDRKALVASLGEYFVAQEALRSQNSAPTSEIAAKEREVKAERVPSREGKEKEVEKGKGKPAPRASPAVKKKAGK